MGPDHRREPQSTGTIPHIGCVDLYRSSLLSGIQPSVSSRFVRFFEMSNWLDEKHPSMFWKMSGILGVLTAAAMAIGAGYVLVTASIPGYRGTATLTVTLYLLALGAIAIGANLIRENLSTPYW